MRKKNNSTDTIQNRREVSKKLIECLISNAYPIFIDEIGFNINLRCEKG